MDHFEARLDAMDGKAMVVCMSRRICVDLYDQIVALRPDWHDEDDGKGEIKVVMTGSASDPVLSGSSIFGIKGGARGWLSDSGIVRIR